MRVHACVHVCVHACMCVCSNTLLSLIVLILYFPSWEFSHGTLRSQSVSKTVLCHVTQTKYVVPSTDCQISTKPC